MKVFVLYKVNMSHVKLFIMISYMYTIIVVCEYVYVLVTCLCAVRQRINNESNLHLITNGPHGPCPCDSLIMLIVYQIHSSKNTTKRKNQTNKHTKPNNSQSFLHFLWPIVILPSVLGRSVIVRLRVN